MERGYYRKMIIDKGLDILERNLKEEVDDLENAIGSVLRILEDESMTNSEKVKKAFDALEDIHDGLY